MSTPQPQIQTKNGSSSSSDEEIHQPFTSLLSSPNIDSSSSTNCTDNNTQDFQRHHVSSLNTLRVSPSNFGQLPPLSLLSSTLPSLTVIPNLEFNVAANAGVISASGGTVVAAELTWGNSDEMKEVGRKYDVIVGSDVVYLDHLYEPLLETLKYFLIKEDEDEDEKEVVFLMPHLKRWKKEKVFFNRAKKLFKVDVIHREKPDDGKRVGVIVYRFIPKQKQRRLSKNKLQI